MRAYMFCDATGFSKRLNVACYSN